MERVVRKGADLCRRIDSGGQGHVQFRLHKRDAAILLLLGLAAFMIMFWRLGEGSLSDYDEADYAQSAREMLWNADWNTPRWNGMEFFDKPPVCYWLTALAYKVFGVNEFGARVVSACAGVLAVLLTYVLGRELFGRRFIGLSAAVMLLTVSPNLFAHGYNFVALARVGQLDMMLILALVAALWFAWRCQHSARYLIWLGVPLGLGLMIKSVAGFIAFGIVGLFFLVALPRRVWWRKELLYGGVLAGLVALPWHLGQLLIWGRQFWDSYMVSLTVGYVTGEQGHTKDVLFYLRSIQRGFPVLYPLVAIAVGYGLYRVVWLARARKEAGNERRAVSLLLCWTAVPMVLYNVSRSRIGWYMIPIYPALALLTAYLLVRIVGSRWAFVLVLAITLTFNPWLPRASDFNPGVKTVASFSRYVVPQDAVLVNYWPDSYWIRPSAVFYANRPLLLVTNEQALRRLLATPGEVYVLADAADWEPVQELGQEVYRFGGYVLVKALLQIEKSEGHP